MAIDEKKLIEDIEKEFDGVCVYDVSPSQAINDFVQIVNRQPKVGEWTPCSERLPEEDGEYLVWVRYEGREFTTTEEYEDGMWNYSGAYNFNDKVIAWMPLPEQYKGE